MLLPGKQRLSLPMTLLLGAVGSLIGGTIAFLLGTGSIWELDFLGFVLSVVAAVGLLMLGERSGYLTGARKRE